MVPTKDEYHGATPYEEIIKDKTKAFARRIGDDAWHPVLWAGICRDNGDGRHLAALTKDGKALGVNVMYLDGHAEWVDKKKLKPRYSVGAYKVFL